LAKRPVGLLSFGLLILLLALSLAMASAGLIGFSEVPSSVIALFGVWLMVLAGVQSTKQEKHERSAFSIFSWGVFISALGIVWFLSIRQILLGYLPSVFLLVIGTLIVIAALRYWKK